MFVDAASNSCSNSSVPPFANLGDFSMKYTKPWQFSALCSLSHRWWNSGFAGLEEVSYVLWFYISQFKAWPLTLQVLFLITSRFVYLPSLSDIPSSTYQIPTTTIYCKKTCWWNTWISSCRDAPLRFSNPLSCTTILLRRAFGMFLDNYNSVYAHHSPLLGPWSVVEAPSQDPLHWSKRLKENI